MGRRHKNKKNQKIIDPMKTTNSHIPNFSLTFISRKLTSLNLYSIILSLSITTCYVMIHDTYYA